jgi:hypothetical protein
VEFWYLEAWLKAACMNATNMDKSMMTAKWQAPMIDRKVNTWMERHTQYVNAVPFEALAHPPGALAPPGMLDPQTCFDKAMHMPCGGSGYRAQLIKLKTSLNPMSQLCNPSSFR